LKLDILDPYNIRARLSPSIILLGPIALTVFFCFENLYTTLSSTIILFILLALTNYIPILQRKLSKQNLLPENYAAQLLYYDNTEIDEVTRKRYYRKLALVDSSFSLFLTPTNTQDFKNCCNSAIIYLRNNPRDNHLVLEENINCGFCKNMLINKPVGIILNIFLAAFSFSYSWIFSGSIVNISGKIWFSIGINFVLLLFWIIGINKRMLDEAAKRYAHTLIYAIDSLKLKDENEQS